MSAALAFIAIIDGNLWLRGTKSGAFLSADTTTGNAIGWSRKAPAGSAKPALPIGPELETALRAAIRAYRPAWGGTIPPYAAWVPLDNLTPTVAAMVQTVVDAAAKGGKA